MSDDSRHYAGLSPGARKAAVLNQFAAVRSGERAAGEVLGRL
jgi:hypothetical protein